MPQKRKLKKLNFELENFIQKLGVFYESVGLTNIAGKIMGLLLVWGDPISPLQISKILRVSRGSVSNSLRLLKVYGYLEEKKIAGVRNKFYSFSESAWQNAMKVRLQTYIPLVAIMQEGRSIMEREKLSTKIFDEALVLIQKEQEFYNHLINHWEEEVTSKIEKVKD